MRSHAPLSSSRPPRTLCSASAECGGTRSRATSSSPEASERGSAGEKVVAILAWEGKRTPPVDNVVDRRGTSGGQRRSANGTGRRAARERVCRQFRRGSTRRVAQRALACLFFPASTAGRASGGFAKHDDLDFDDDVGVRRDRHGVLADGL